MFNCFHCLNYQSPLFLQLVLELCRGDGVGNLQSIQSHLDKIHNCSSELSSNAQVVEYFKKPTDSFK